MKYDTVGEILLACRDIRKAENSRRSYVLWGNLIDICLSDPDSTGNATLEVSFYECGLFFSTNTAAIKDIACGGKRFAIVGQDSSITLWEDDCRAVKNAIRGIE